MSATVATSSESNDGPQYKEVMGMPPWLKVLLSAASVILAVFVELDDE